MIVGVFLLNPCLVCSQYDLGKADFRVKKERKNNKKGHATHDTHSVLNIVSKLQFASSNCLEELSFENFDERIQ